MAGANNAQMKAAGYKPRDIVKARATHGKLSHDTMASGGFALRKGFERPATKAKGPKAEPPAGWQAAARGDSPGARARSDAAKAEARAVYQRGNEGARGKVGDMRSDIRGRVSAVRAADTKHRDAIASARSRAERANPAVKGGKDAQRRKLERERKVDEAITRDPAVQQTARDRKAAREGLSAALASRDAVARGRKQAATPGQMDMFGAAPQRGPSPFEKRMAARDARAKGLRSLAGTMMANRKAGAASAAAKAAVKAAPAPKPAAPQSQYEVIRAVSQKTGGGGLPPSSYRSGARRAIVDAGTARAKMVALEREHATRLAAVQDAYRKGGKRSGQEAERRASYVAMDAAKARDVYKAKRAEAKDDLRQARKIESALPADVRAAVKKKPERLGGSLGATPAAKARMADAKARLPELRAARDQRIQRQLMRGETVRQLADTRRRLGAVPNFNAKKNDAMEAKGARARNRAFSTLKRAIGSEKAMRAVSITESTAKSASFRQWKAQAGRD